MDFLSVENIAFTVLDYPMSYVEFIGTIFYLLSVWLIARRNVWTWPIGIISVLLYMVLFYQIQLYSDTLEQVYYLGASVYGWWFWTRRKSKKDDAAEDHLREVGFSTRRSMGIWIAVTLVGSLLLGVFMTQAHILIPSFFTLPADYPYLDAFTTVMSFTAMWLMARKRIESWVYWIIVDVIGIGLYFVKEVRFLSLLYVILLVLALNGLREWWQAYQKRATTT
jgi:nicotinamide mononucleotide transporter